MNDLGGASSNSNGNNFSDSSLMSGSDSKLCRDFIRNVCHRGKNCKFIHPENIKIRNEPIFCHDFQQNRCHRPTCKFIHCSRETEEHYKKTGELPDNVYEPENGHGSGGGNGSSGGGGNDGRNSVRNMDGNGNSSSSSRHNNNKGISRSNGDGGDSCGDVPICKDYLKGACNRPPGSCKYRHVNGQNDSGRNNNRSSSNGRNSNLNLNMNLNNSSNGKIGGGCGGGGGGGGLRRRGSDGFYDVGPEIKKIRPTEHPGFAFRSGEEFNENFYVGNNIGQGYSALPPPPPPHSEAHLPNPGHHHHGPPTSAPDNHHAFTQFHQPPTSTYAVTGATRNGYNSGAGSESVTAYMHPAEAMKALEDENFMLKRRIEELKTSNEFLLNQNAQLRLNSTLSVSRTNVGVENVQVQPAVGVASVASGVVQTMVSMAQPMGITPSLSVAATQPLSTISTLPTVSMPPVSISQALPVVSISQHQPQPQSVYPMVTTQGVLPQPPNLT